MSNRAKNFRRRTEDDDDDDNDNNANGTNSSTAKPPPKPVAAAAKPKKPTSQAPKKLLSFADDEENDSPVSRPSSRPSSAPRLSKPSSSSHRHTSTKDRSTPSSSSSLLPSNVQPQAGTYTKEALLELQKNTKTLASSRTHQSRDTRPPTSEPVFLLKGLVKPLSNADPIAKTLKSIDELDHDEDGVFDKKTSSLRRDRDDATTRLASIGLGKSGEVIPDQATIDAIRATRERRRQSRAVAPDFIALDGGSNHGEAEGLSDEEPEFQGRIALFGEKVDGGKRGVFEEAEANAIDGRLRKGSEATFVDEEEDEEDKMWEEEQFRKGLGKRMDDGSSRNVMSSSVPVVQSTPQPKTIYQSPSPFYPSGPSVPTAPSIGGALGGFSGLDGMSISQQAEQANKALFDNLKRMKESHGRTEASLTKTDENLSASLLNVTALERSLSAAGEKFIFMQKLRDFVSVICDFLQHKAPFIEELEDQMQKLHEQRAEAIIARRAADNDDEMMEIEVAVNAAMLVINKGGNSTAIIEAATSAAQAALVAAREKRNLPVKLDEFGRDINLQKRMDTERRAEARRHRKARSDSKRISSMETDSSYQRIEGESSTDESDSESTAYQSNREMLLQTAEQIFGDAAEEYSQLSVVKQRFETFKREYSSSYNDAYMSLSVPAIFSPYVRLELLKWDPLHEDADFDNMKWHTLLYNYGIEDEREVSSDDADTNVIPQLVEKIAVPILHHQLAYCWDILSTHETKNAVSATDLIFAYVPASSKAIGELVTVLRNRLADAVSKLMVPTWSSLVIKAVPNAARVAAYKFGMSVRLMRNICLWNKILALPVLEKLALDDLLSGKVLPHLRSIQANVHDAVTRTERIVASLLGVWAGTSVAGERSPRLQPLVDYLLTLGKALEKKHVSGASEAETIRLARRLKKMLVDLNEYDRARAISRTFSLKEAL